MPDSFDLSEGATRGYLAAGTALLGLTAVRALYRLDVPAFWFDEAVSWRNINGTWLFQLRRAQGGEDLGGFLYSAILKLWSSVAGCSEYALRFPSVLFALALVGVLWVLGRLLWGQLAGLCVAATATILPGYLDYAREARGYSFLMLATAVAVLGLVVYRKKRRWGEWLLLLGTGAAIATHSFGLFVWAGVTGAHLWLVWKLDKPGRSIRAWFHAGAALLHTDSFRNNLDRGHTQDDYAIHRQLLAEPLDTQRVFGPPAIGAARCGGTVVLAVTGGNQRTDWPPQVSWHWWAHPSWPDRPLCPLRSAAIIISSCFDIFWAFCRWPPWLAAICSAGCARPRCGTDCRLAGRGNGSPVHPAAVRAGRPAEPPHPRGGVVPARQRVARRLPAGITATQVLDAALLRPESLLLGRSNRKPVLPPVGTVSRR